MRNLLIVISGPSGVGKGTIAAELVKRENKFLSISCTTRNPREGEKDGREYFFITKEQFLEKIKNGGLLEYSEHFENYYGTPKDYVKKKLKVGDVILEIDVNGGIEVKKNCKDALLIMIVPPSLDELKNRLNGRHTESEEKINLRLQRVEYELGKQSEYDYTVVNDDLEKAIDQVIDIINKEKAK